MRSENAADEERWKGVFYRERVNKGGLLSLSLSLWWASKFSTLLKCICVTRGIEGGDEGALWSQHIKYPPSSCTYVYFLPVVRFTWNWSLLWLWLSLIISECLTRLLFSQRLSLHFHPFCLLLIFHAAVYSGKKFFPNSIHLRAIFSSYKFNTLHSHTKSIHFFQVLLLISTCAYERLLSPLLHVYSSSFIFLLLVMWTFTRSLSTQMQWASSQVFTSPCYYPHRFDKKLLPASSLWKCNFRINLMMIHLKE